MEVSRQAVSGANELNSPWNKPHNYRACTVANEFREAGEYFTIRKLSTQTYRTKSKPLVLLTLKMPSLRIALKGRGMLQFESGTARQCACRACFATSEEFDPLCRGNTKDEAKRYFAGLWVSPQGSREEVASKPWPWTRPFCVPQTNTLNTTDTSPGLCKRLHRVQFFIAPQHALFNSLGAEAFSRLCRGYLQDFSLTCLSVTFSDFSRAPEFQEDVETEKLWTFVPGLIELTREANHITLKQSNVG